MMTPNDVQRLRYFDGQFLREPDFTLEQTYHLTQQRDHARLMHSPGIAEGLDVRVSNDNQTQVVIDPGVAYDRKGRRLVLTSSFPLDLDALPSDQPVYIAIQYHEEQAGPQRDDSGISGFTRWVEAPEIKVLMTLTNEHDSGLQLILGKVLRTGVNVQSIETSDRRMAGVRVRTTDLVDKAVSSEKLADASVTSPKLAVGAVTSRELADGAVTAQKLEDGAVTGAKIADGTITLQKLDAASRPIMGISGVSNPGGTVDFIAKGAITISPDDTNNQIAIGENHSTLVGNPHGTSAADLGALVSLNGIKNVDGNINLVSTGAITITPSEMLSDRLPSPGSLERPEVLERPGLLDRPGLLGPPGTPSILPPRERTITIGENHSVRNDNPHRTTAEQVGAVPLAGGTISGNLGIGVTPQFPLDVQGRMRIRQIAGSNQTAGVWFSGYYKKEFDSAFFGMQRENIVGIYGNIGRPDWRMTVALDTGDLELAGNAFKPGGGAWSTRSDGRLKRDVEPLNDSLDRLLKLKPISFEWKEPERQGNLTGRQIGFLAEDVEEVFPEWVGVDQQGMKTLSIRGFEALAVEALKQLKQENDQLKEALARMQEKLDGLEQRKRRLAWPMSG